MDQHLAANLSRLDRLQSGAEEILAGPGDADIGARAEELRELIVELQALVEQKLDQLS